MGEVLRGIRANLDKYTGHPVAKARRRRLSEFGFNLPQKPKDHYDWEWEYTNEHISALSNGEFDFVCKALEIFGPSGSDTANYLRDLNFFIEYHRLPLDRIRKILSDFAPASISLSVWNSMFYSLVSLDDRRRPEQRRPLSEEDYQKGLNRTLMRSGSVSAVEANKERLIKDREVLFEVLADDYNSGGGYSKALSPRMLIALIPIYASAEIAISSEERKRLAMLAAQMGVETLSALSAAFPDDPDIAHYGHALGDTLASPSRQVRELLPELLPTLLPQLADDPAKYRQVLTQVERIFLRNHVPFAGKQYRIFSIMSGIFLGNLKYKNIESPALKNARSERAVKSRVFKDLLQISLLSGESSLVDFFMLLNDVRPLLAGIEAGGMLSEADSARLGEFLKRMEAIRVNPEKAGSGMTEEGLTLDALKTEYRCKPGEGLIDKIESLFLRRIGVNSIGEALLLIDGKLKGADAYNRAFAKSPVLKAGDMVKGTYSKYLYDNLERGFFAPEFIGTSHRSSDATPFDVDMAMLKSDGWGGTAMNLAKGYGDILLILKDRGQFSKNPKYPHEYERFGLSVYKDKGHAGIRTGFASTEVSGIILKDKRDYQLNAIKDAIVRKGFYVPIFSFDQRLLFSAEEFDTLRRAYAQFEQMGQKQTRDQFEDFLSNPNLTSEEIVAYGRALFPEVFKKSVGVAEGYTYDEHVGYVMRQFERYGKGLLPKDMPLWLMRFFILNHDIGKPMGVEVAGSTSVQHTFTTELLGRLMQSSGFTPQERALLTALAEGDYVGQYIQGRKSFDETVLLIKEGAIRGEVTPEHFFSLLDAYYLSDAGSYTKDAGAKASLDHLFVFNKHENTADYALGVKEKIEGLRYAVAA